MTIETSTYPSQWNSAYPEAGSAFTEGDDHIRKLKANIKATFPNFTAIAITPTSVELNYVDGVTSAIQTQLDAKAPLASPTLTGTPAAPTATYGTNTTQLATTEFVQASRGNDAGGSVGTYILAQSASSGLFLGSAVSGASLSPVQLNSGGTQTTPGSTLSGSWKCMGYANGTTVATLFVRYL